MTVTREHLAAFEALIEEHITLLGFTNDTARSAQLALCAQSAHEPVQGEVVAGCRRADKPYEITAYPSVCATWHRHGFPVQALYTAAAKPDAELVEFLRQLSETMRRNGRHEVAKRIDAKLASLKGDKE